MAKIKIVDRSVLQSGAPIDATQTGATPLAVVGSQVAKIGAEYQQKEHQSFISNEVTTRYANYIKSDSDYTSERSSNPAGHATLVNDWTANSKALRKSAFDGLADPDAQRILNERIISYNARQHINVSSHARKQGVGVARDQADQTLSSLGEQAITAKNSDVPDLIMAAQDNLMMQTDAGTFSQGEANKRLKLFNNKVQVGRIQQMMRDQPYEAYKILKNNKTLPGIKPGQHLSLQRQSFAIHKQNQATAKINLISLKQDDIKSLAATGKGVPGAYERILSVEGKTAAAKYKVIQNDAKTIYSDKENMYALNSPSKINKYVAGEAEKLKALAGKRGYAKQEKRVALLSAEAQKMGKLIKNDVVTYLNKHPSMQNLSEETETMAKGATALIGQIAGDSPLMQSLGQILSTEIQGDKGNALQRLRRKKLLSLETSLGIPKNKQSLLTKGQSIGLVSMYGQAKNDQKTLLFKQLQQEYGKDYGIVFKDMMKHGLPPEANLFNAYGQLKNGAILAPILSNVLSMSKKDYSEMEKNLTSQQKKSIKASVESNLSLWQSTMAATDTFGDLKVSQQNIKAAMVKMVTFQVDRNKGDASTIAKDIIRKTFDADYGGAYNYQQGSFSVRSQRTGLHTRLTANIRIPKKYTPLLVRRGIAKKQTTASMQEFKPVPSAQFLSAFTKDRAGAVKSYITAVQGRGYWVTKPDDSGLWLLDNRGGFVLDKDGNRYGYTFKDEE